MVSAVVRTQSNRIFTKNWAHPLLITMSILLTACGGGDDGGTTTPTPTPQTQEVTGGGVKGPLANADVVAHLVDFTNSATFQGAQVATGTTSATTAAITGLALPLPLESLYILEFTSNAMTTDITTGQAPVITTLRTVATQAMLTAGNVYATPQTTIATDIAIANADKGAPYAGNNDGTTTTQEFLDALPIAATQVMSTLGFGATSSVDIWNTPPVIDSSITSPAQETAVAQYRTAVEALTAVVFAMSNNAGVNSDVMLAELTSDLSDGLIDGNINNASSNIITQAVLSDLTNVTPANLTIPNTPILLSDIETLLVDEKSTTGSTASTPTLEGTDVFNPQPANTVPDIDGDGTRDDTDNCPYLSNMGQADTNSNGVGNACEAAPVADDQTVDTLKNTGLPIVLTGTDAENDNLTFTVVTDPLRGSLTGTPPNITYTPEVGYVGTDRIEFTVNDGASDSASGTINITVMPQNFPPVANDQTVTTLEDTEVAITLTGSDADGDTLTYTVTVNPTNGTLTGTAPNLIYTPKANYFGLDADSIEFSVSDSQADSAVAGVVSINITEDNDAPVAVVDSATVTSGGTVTVLTNDETSVLANDTDVDNTTLSAVLVDDVTSGTLTLNAEDGTFSYTHNGGASTTDSFTYQAFDGALSSDVVTVSISITPTPVPPVIQGVWLSQLTAESVIDLNEQDTYTCDITQLATQKAHVSVAQTDTSFTMVGVDGSSYSGTVDIAGNISFTGSRSGSYPDVSTGTATNTLVWSDSITAGVATTTNTNMTSGSYIETQTRLGQARCEIAYSFVSQKVYAHNGAEDYNGVYAVEAHDYSNSPRGANESFGAGSTQIEIAGNSINVYFASEGENCSESTNNGVFDPNTGAFSINVESNCSYPDDNERSVETGTITGIFVRAPTEATLPSLYFLWEAESRDFNNADPNLGTQTWVTQLETYGYAKKVATTEYTRTNQLQKASNRSFATIHMGLLNPPLKTNAPGNKLFIEVLDTTITPTKTLCSESFTATANSLGRYNVISRYSASKATDFTDEQFSNGAYSFVSCNTSATDGTPQVSATVEYTVHVVDAGANGVVDAGDSVIDSYLAFPVINSAPFTTLVSRQELRLDGARVSASQTGAITPMWGFFNPSETHTLTWNTGPADPADSFIIRLAEINDFVQTQYTATGDATSLVLPTYALAGNDPTHIQFRINRNSGGSITNAIAARARVFPGVRGLFNIELGATRQLQTFQVWLDGRDVSLNECTIPSASWGLTCNGGTFDMANNSVTLNLTDDSGLYTGTPTTAFDLTLHFNDAVNAEVTSTNLTGVPTATQGVNATTAAHVAVSEFFTRTRRYSHIAAALPNVRTRFNANNMRAMGVWDKATLTRADGSSFIDGTDIGVASYTLWDDTVMGSTYADKFTDFHQMPTGDGVAQGTKHFIGAEYNEVNPLGTPSFNTFFGGDYVLTLTDSSGVEDDLEFRHTYTRADAATMIAPSMSQGDIITVNNLTQCANTQVVGPVLCDDTAPVLIASLDSLTWPVDANVPATAWWRIQIREVVGGVNLPTGQQRTPMMQDGVFGLSIVAGTAGAPGTATWTNPGDFVLDSTKTYSIQLLVQESEKSRNSKEYATTSKQSQGDWLYFTIP